jgi:hypothetical protein
MSSLKDSDYPLERFKVRHYDSRLSKALMMPLKITYRQQNIKFAEEFFTSEFGMNSTIQLTLLMTLMKLSEA